MPNPIRRLSVALKITKSFKSAASSPVAAPDQNLPLAEFLVSAKERYINAINETPSKAGEWTVVMGNEAGGT